MGALLYTKDLRKNFGGLLAVNNANVSIEDRELRSIIGPNGAGKTTFINLITGRYPASGGNIFFQGRDITNQPTHELVRLGICRTFQITSIFLGLSVFENVRMARQSCLGGSLRIFSSKARLKEVNETTWALLEKIGLQEKADQPAKNLAHGDQRLLEVGLALAGDPKILILDEPTAGMSPTETNQIADLVRQLNRDLNLPVVLIEHDMEMVMAISDRITVFHQGSMIAEGSPKEIQENKFVKEAYLGETDG
jgi:ABC-type branched-subunit amino acid transport system ATPase component